MAVSVNCEIYNSILSLVSQPAFTDNLYRYLTTQDVAQACNHKIRLKPYSKAFIVALKYFKLLCGKLIYFINQGW